MSERFSGSGSPTPEHEPKPSKLKGDLVRRTALAKRTLVGSLVAQSFINKESDKPVVPRYIQRDSGKVFEEVSQVTRDDEREIVKLREVDGEQTVTRLRSDLEAILAKENGAWAAETITTTAEE